VTKLYITLKDCNGKVVFKSAVKAKKESISPIQKRLPKLLHWLKYKYNGAKVQVQTAWYKTLLLPTVVENLSAEAMCS
jgi:hypothetical protein